jgi:Hypothetical protein (DUF2513)
VKRNTDLLRSILLEIEEKDEGNGHGIDFELSEYSEATVVEHLFQLYESGMIEGNDVSHMQGRGFSARRLTSRGHDFLDTIRDPEIWRQTKDGAKEAGGFTLELLSDLAKGFIKTQVKKHTGIEV